MASGDSSFVSRVTDSEDQDRNDSIFGDHQDSSTVQTVENVGEDICRVCRGVSQKERPLFHPCLCSGSIRYVHQDCLVQWLKHSGKQVCELCQHRFQFAPIFREDMPHKLPVTDLIFGIARGALKNMRHWMHLSFVALMWLLFVPVCIYRIYKFLMYDSAWSIVKLPFEILSLDNILLDCIYGLLVVIVSLLGFISIVWLKDQLGHGVGPNWLEEDRREVNRVVMREAQERVDLLRRHLEEAGERARERQRVPDRVAAAAELSALHDLMGIETKRLSDLQFKKIELKINKLWKREMEIMYDTGSSMLKCQDLLRSAREKRYKGLHEWKEKNKSLLEKDFLPPPNDEDLGLNFKEQVISSLYDSPQRILSDGDIQCLKEELKEIRSYQMKLVIESKSLSAKLCKLMSFPNNKLGAKNPDTLRREVIEESGGQGEEPYPNSYFALLLSEMDEEERSILHRIWDLKREIRDSAKQESIIIGRQHEQERARREVVEVRMNRWYNRLLNRHQNDPLILARRQRHHRRPNIGHAIAGLARERNPMELDDVGDNVEELTWARLLGLDGSFRFLEHVIWLICLNSALIICFVYIPYQLGYFVASLFSFWTLFGVAHWSGILSSFIGYCTISLIVLAFYYGTGRLNKPRVRSALGITFISIKVGMILAVEAGIFPLMCGWWIDLCSFTFFNSTLTLRQESIARAPGTIMFLHWLAGMIFIFYLASFVMLLREVLRPGVLWFLRNLNDQNFHPITEMINLPLQRHVRRFLMSCVLFGVCVMVVLLLPSKIIPLFSDTFLPYKFYMTNTVSPIREVQIELILLQFIIPTLLEHGNCRAGFKVVINCWASLAAKLFGLDSYLLDKSQTGGNLVDVHGTIIREVPFEPNHEGPIYTGRLQVLGAGFAPFKPYLRPRYFYFRVVIFLLYTLLTAVIFSTILLIAPVAIGRLSLRMIGLVDAPEMYTASIGLYIIWIVIKLLTAIIPSASEGLSSFIWQIGTWIVLFLKCLLAGFILFIIIPLIMGYLVDLFLLSPLRVPSNKTPVFYPSTEWALGLLHTKCVCGLIWLTNANFKNTLETVYQAGIRNINLTFILLKVAWPVISILSLIIAVPYILSVGMLNSLGSLSYCHSVILYRYFFPTSLVLILIVALLCLGYVKCKRLYDHVRNEKYLVGRQLINFIGVDEQ